MRDSTTQFSDSIAQPIVYSIAMFKVAFDSGVLAWNSSFSNISYNGDIYIATGNLASISSVTEQVGTKPSSLNVGVSGVKQEVVSLLQSEPYMNRKAYIYHAIVGEDLVFDPNRIKLIFVGTVDSISGKMGKSPSFNITIKSRLADWERSRNLMYNDVDQQLLYPGDRFMEYIPQISNKKILWPKAKALLDPRD